MFTHHFQNTGHAHFLKKKTKHFLETKFLDEIVYFVKCNALDHHMNQNEDARSTNTEKKR